ncbi:ISL3 family transposase [Verrucosispora sp. WMMD1129]|uniref:ISL3 family transposase n=1 Tax=Verrucosispora sp. WMMD1129 TaxID=3016093 RepID=UPI00249BF57C|nr:ISL3 family transposase [Verrucosispora sp. WMMD1129]WFE44513.1 ISL3 family transposase [Verrucosispora sp. WMMD1129]
MRSVRLWGRLLGVEQVVVESVCLDAAGVVVVSVRPLRRARGRCGVCQRRCPGYDAGRGRRRWRSLDVGVWQVFLEADAPRVRCPVHGVVVAAVPWARHGAGHTRQFDALVGWLVRRMSKTAVCHLVRVGWRTVGQIVTRVVADADAAAGDRLAGVRRIGIDEVSYRRGHKYLTVVVDHDTRRLLWIAEGRDSATLSQFFDLLGSDRCAQISLVTADGAEWIFSAVSRYCPQARICLDPFHVVMWAGKALDAVRAQVYTAARKAGQKALAQGIKGARYALWKNPADLTASQQAKLATIEHTNQPLYRAYLLNQQLRQVFAAPGGADRITLLDAWLDWATTSQLTPFVELAYRIRRYWRDDIANTLTYRLSNGLIESTNTKIRLLTRIAFGFKNPHALIAMVRLHLCGYDLPLPGRT